MDVSRSAWVVLFACVSLPALPVLQAQSASFTMPPGFLTAEHGSSSSRATPYSAFLGSYPELRMQVLSGDWTGSGSVTLKSLSLRRDSEYYYPTTHGVARSWTNVLLRIADSDFGKPSATFSVNFRGTPATVFSGALSWADTSKQPSGSQTWGGFNMRFPFASPHAWSRQRDVCIDFRFTGGKLANSGSWSAANYVLLDGFSDHVDNGPHFNLLATKGCNAAGQSTPGFLAASFTTHGPKHAKPNSLTIDIFQAYGAPLTDHFGGLGVVGDPNGVAIGVCEKLYLFHTPVDLHYRTDANGLWGLVPVTVPYDVSFGGLVIYSQSAYVDPVSKRFALSGGMRSVIAPLPADSGFKQLRVYASDGSATAGSLASTYVPILKLN